MRRLSLKLSAVLCACGLAGAGPARAALSNDGTVSVEYSGKLAQAYIGNVNDPAYGQGQVTFTWDETATFALSGRAEHQETSRLLSWKLTVGGGNSVTYPPPNAYLDCSAGFSLRPGATSPISAYYHNGAVSVTATLPRQGTEVQSSVSDPRSHCYVSPNGGLGYPSPDSATVAYENMLLDHATVPVPSNPFSRPDSANGTGVAQDNSKVTQSLNGVIQVTTNGQTAPPPKQGLTPAEIEAKKNALEALRQTLSAALYPCVSLAAGNALLAVPSLASYAVAAALIALAGPLCADYSRTIMAEIATVKDPPRGDFNLLASAAPAAGAASSGPARRLLAAADATRAAAEAVSTTLAREVGARQAHNRAAADRQDRRLKALVVTFARRRAAEISTGRALAASIRATGNAPRLSATRVRTAEATLLSRLAGRGLSRANVGFVGGLLRRGPLDVLPTLGR